MKKKHKLFGKELSTREEEVLELVRKGYTTRQIAQRLVLEIGTVKNHRHNICAKTGVKRVQELLK